MSKRVPKSILMTADTVGGVWTYSLELARALEPYGIEVHLAVMGPALTRTQHEDAREISNLNLFKSDFKLEWMLDSGHDVKRAGAWLLHLENRLHPDVIHLNGYAHAALPWNAPTLVAGHSCVFSWWRAVHGDVPPAEWQRYKTEVTAGLQAADLVVAPSKAMLDALVAHYGTRDNALVIPNGRDPSLFRSSAKQEFILSAGRLWDEAKNIGQLNEIAPELPWPVFIAGDSQHPQQQNSFTGKRCHSLGTLAPAELHNWYAVAPVYALPALYEPFGYTPLEAALSGCALVLGDIESLREVWQDAAVFVSPGDSLALKTKLIQLIEDRSYRREMSERATQRAREFNSERMAEGYAGAYSDLLVRRKERFAQCA
jgi:glycogen synthase